MRKKVPGYKVPGYAAGIAAGRKACLDAMNRALTKAQLAAHYPLLRHQIENAIRRAVAPTCSYREGPCPQVRYGESDDPLYQRRFRRWLKKHGNCTWKQKFKP